MVRFGSATPGLRRGPKGAVRRLQQVLAVVTVTLVLMLLTMTSSHAASNYKNQDSGQSVNPGLAAAIPSYADCTPNSTFLTLGARLGAATCYGSNGPAPVHVCLSDEMGIGYNTFFGFLASLNLVDRNDYGATVELDVNHFQFHGNGTVTDTVTAREYSLVIGDSLSGDNTTTIGAVNTDFHLGSSFTHFVKFYPRLQFVEYAQDMSLTNHTRGWADSGTARYQLLGGGGVLQIGQLPLLSDQFYNGFWGALAHDLRLSGAIGTGGKGVTYWNWKVALAFMKYRSAALQFAQRNSQIEAEAGASMWQILEPPVSRHWGDMGRVDTLMFYLQLSATF
ncbi:MAG: hypothetical protein ACP5U1_12145 [Desulfomonilaceae bacterium]